MKKKRGRKKLEIPSISVLIHLRLQKNIDDDLIQYILSIPNGKRASAVKSALRSGGIRIVENNDESENELSKSIDDFLK